MRDKKLNILLIEDNPGDVRLIKEMAYEFEDNTFNIIHAKSFSEGIKKYEEQKYNVVLLDLFLPDSVGLETVSNILRKITDIPIIILSGISNQILAIEAVKLGAQDYLIKDKVNSNLLGRSIYYAIERHQIKEKMKDLAKNLRMSEVKLNALFEKAPYAIILHTLEGKILNANKEAESLFVDTHEKLLTHNIFDLFNKEDSSKFKKKILNIFEENSSINKFEATIQNILKTFINVEISFVCLKFDGEILVETYFIDISERRNNEKNRKFLIDQLLNSLEAKSTFFASMSHDFRTPLNAIIGFSDLLLEGTFGKLSTEQVEFLKDIRNSAEDLFRLLANILDFSEVESGIFKLNIVNFKLLPLINNLITILRPMYKKKGLVFNLEGIDENTKINADLLKFKQILYNLFENAIKFTDKGKFIFRGIERTDHWEFQVSDMGEGISVEDYEIVFRGFERIDNYNYVKKSVSGSGLGLALTKRLIHLHSGEIWFKSELNKGTTFFFTIPKNAN
jgi:PAS domain S-box-containing protein